MKAYLFSLFVFFGNFLFVVFCDDFAVYFDTDKPLGLKLSSDLVIQGFHRSGQQKLAAELSNWIRVGDRLLSINELPVLGVSLPDVAKMIQTAEKPKKLVFRASGGSNRTEEMSHFSNDAIGYVGHEGELEFGRGGNSLGVAKFLQGMFGGPLNCRAAPVSFAVPSDGCGAFRNAKLVMNTFVLVERGGCSFSDKAILAQQSSALGLVVINSPGSDLVRMPISDSEKQDISLPVVMISYEDSVVLKGLLNEGASGTILARMIRKGAECAKWIRAATKVLDSLDSDGIPLDMNSADSTGAGSSLKQSSVGRVLYFPANGLPIHLLSAISSSEASVEEADVLDLEDEDDVDEFDYDYSELVSEDDEYLEESVVVSSDGTSSLNHHHDHHDEDHDHHLHEKLTPHGFQRRSVRAGTKERLHKHSSSPQNRLDAPTGKYSVPVTSTKRWVGSSPISALRDFDNDGVGDASSEAEWDQMEQIRAAAAARSQGMRAAAQIASEYLVSDAPRPLMPFLDLSSSSREPLVPLRLELGMPEDGCGTEPLDTLSGRPVHRTALLVRRGGCPFGEKLRNAAARGVRLLLIGNTGVGLARVPHPAPRGMLSASGIVNRSWTPLISFELDAATLQSRIDALPVVMISDKAYTEMYDALAAAAAVPVSTDAHLLSELADNSEEEVVEEFQDWQNGAPDVPTILLQADPTLEGVWDELAGLLPPQNWPSETAKRRKLYINLSKKNHPDRPGGSAERFELLSFIYKRANHHHDPSSVPDFTDDFSAPINGF